MTYYLTTYANTIIRGPGSRGRMGTFGKGNSASKYTVVEVCDAANSADHNYSLMRHIATDGVAWSVCLCVCNGDNIIVKTAQLIDMPFGSDCPT